MDIPSNMISLSKNDIKLIRQLKLKKFRYKYKKFVCEGFKMCSEVASMYPEYVDFLVFEEKQWQNGHFKGLQHLPNRSRYASTEALKKISSLDTFDGVLAVCHFPNPPDRANSFHFYLDQIQDPGNLGTIMRTADWFGSGIVYLSEGCVDPYNAKTVQASMGSVFRVIGQTTSLHDLTDSHELIGTSMNGQTNWQLQTDKTPVLVLGNESKGMGKNSSDLCHQVWAINNSYNLGAESLNVGVAAGIFAHRLSSRISD